MGKAGRFFCVALPLILTIASIVFMLIATLSGVVSKQPALFTIDLSNAKVDGADVKDILENVKGDLPQDVQDDIDNLDLDDIDLGDVDIDDFNLGDLLDLSGRDVDASLAKRQDDSNSNANTVNATQIGFAKKYEVNLWGYCSISKDNKKNCTKSQFDWAHKTLDLDVLDKAGNVAGSKIDVSDEVKDAVKLFSTVIKWAEIAFIVALVLLGIELVIGIFANCTRVISCLVWLFAILTAVIVCAAAALATATAAIVVGAIEGTEKLFDIDASINTSFLAVIWIAAAFAIAAAVFWLFTICCCKPDHHSKSKRHSDGEKLLPRGGYAPVGDEHDRSSGFYNSPSYSPGYNQGYSHGYATPQYPNSVRSDLAYEPYSQRV